jgi:hypothetical protein
MTMDKRHSLRARHFLLVVTCAAAIGCGADDDSDGDSQRFIGAGGSGGQGGGSGGPSGGVGGQVGVPIGVGGSMPPMPGLGTMMMTPLTAGTGGSAAAGASGSTATAGSGGSAGADAGTAGSAGQAGAMSAGTGGSQAGTGGAAGSGMSGSGGSDGGVPSDEMDPTIVCMGGMPGMDSDAATTRAQTSSRNFAIVQYLLKAPNKISRFQTILNVPKVPTQKSTLFIWPGLQHTGGSDPARIGNGVLQPVLTWGPSCNPSAPRKGSDYMGWWISAMYVNISTGAAGPGGCAGGDAMDVSIADRLYIDIAVDGTEWTQTVLNLANMKKVDFTMDLKGQDQNWVIWDIETPGYSKPIEDTIFEKSVITFTSPVTSCQPTSAAEVDYFSAPVLSLDGLNCCIDKMILKVMRN